MICLFVLEYFKVIVIFGNLFLFIEKFLINFFCFIILSIFNLSFEDGILILGWCVLFVLWICVNRFVIGLVIIIVFFFY